MKKLLLLIVACLASTAILEGSSFAATICVDPYGSGDYTDLQAALDEAMSNGESDVIRVVQGTYTRMWGFSYNSDQGYSITLIGGCTAGCTDWVVDPTNTVLISPSKGYQLNVAHSAGGDITIEGFTIQNGGGIRAQSLASSASGVYTAGDITITSNIVAGNSGTSFGGGVFAYSAGQGSGETGGAVTLTNNTITGNTADNTGGGAYAVSNSYSCTAGPVTLTNNIISGNLSGDYGGGVYARSYTNTAATSSNVTLINNIITGNTAITYGGGLYASSNVDGGGTAGTVTLTDNTVTGNTTATTGGAGGICLNNYNNTINCYNNIIWGNTDPSGVDIRLMASSDGTSNSYNNDYSTKIGTWDSEISKIDVDPEFIDPEHGDFRLRSSSSCIDAGETNVPGPPGLHSTDFEGDTRIIDTTVDIGADEVSVITTCVSDETGFQNALTTAQSNTKSDIIMVQQGTYTGNFTYSSGETKDIKLFGGYTSSCTSREINPSNTVLDGNNIERVLYLYNSNGKDITVEGFTIQNGNTANFGGGVYARSYSPSGTAGKVTLKANTITDNTSLNAGGVYALSDSDNGTAGAVTLTKNTISNNTATGTAPSHGGGGVRATTKNGNGDTGSISLTGNIISKNIANKWGGVAANSEAYSGNSGAITLVNNIIAGNTANTSDGGIRTYSFSDTGTSGTVTLTNNTITGNSATMSAGGLYLKKYSNGILSVSNNIIRGNTASSGVGDIYLDGTSGTANSYNNNYSTLSGTWDSETGKIDLNPRLSINYNLKSGSPCIDAGINAALFIPATDINGNDRIIDGDRDDTATVDMGADEFIPKGVLTFLMLLLN